MTQGQFKSNLRITFSSGQTVKFDNVTLAQGGAYNPSTGEFNCSVDGLYEFNVHFNMPPGGILCFQLQKNANEIAGLYESGLINKGGFMSTVVRLQRGDIVRVAFTRLNCRKAQLYQNDNDVTLTNYFTGLMVHNEQCNKS